MDGRHALEAVLEVFGVVPVDIGCPDEVLPFLARALVIYPKAAFAVGIHDVVIARLRYGGPCFAASYGHPEAFGACRRIVWREDGHGNRRIILLSGIQPVGKLVIHGNLVQLGRGLVLLGGPVAACVAGDVRSAVVALDPFCGIAGVDPDFMGIPVRYRHAGPGLAPIVRAPEVGRRHEEDIGV